MRIGRRFFLARGSFARIPHSLERVEVGNFVGDRVLGHRRERAQDAAGPGGGSALDPEHVVDQGEGVAAAQLAQRPLLQGDALDLHVEPRGRCDARWSRWCALSEGGGSVQVAAYSPRVSGRSARPYASSIARWASRLQRERALAAVPVTGWRDATLAVAAGVAGNPDDLPGGVAALGRGLAESHATSPGTQRNAPGENRTLDLRLERPALFGAR